ncbi:isoprenylcysteine carboxyl methyltransferase family protein [Filibacter tadaridae]|uniref:Isoprenylcysteine carboxyl methyltransferase (ICMT) family protein n=1 Tax=Filibacter tadaridae TaxID=2483811 RepID=A0A3P5X2P1_9BACL|nr:isoprenylcysteine carboxyl methyltransferase family protein [Filibacter tadaridae]VDC25511.1 Isoprenylcysteine carboxyl methyltransferase (ICMT) family protein [Filibacter tadaridae]
MLFILVISIVIVQRLVELIVAKRNEKWMRSQGAYEAGAAHYPLMVLMHVAFFVSLILEVIVFNRPFSPLWGVLLGIFLVAQVMRIWCLTSLGKFWNTKIIILPGADVVRKGPYLWVRHPNYVIVTTELLVLPLLFGAYFTAIIFTLLNVWMLSVRIPTEEKALKEVTNYREKFSLE